MKKLFKTKALLSGFVAISCLYACKKDHNGGGTNLYNIAQTNLVADTAGFGAAKIDTNLKNAWGLAPVPNGPIWISANHSGVSVVYDKTGASLLHPVPVPSTAPGLMGEPSGVVFNSTTDFGGSKFIFAGEDGTVSTWTAGAAAAVKVIDRSASNVVYKGLTIDTSGGANFLYVANFREGKIDVYDKNFVAVTNKPFADPGIPAGFAPFNIQNIGGQLYVAYAKQKGGDDPDDQAGPGNGYVDVFSSKGTLIKRFASQATLNSPWGMALAPAGFADINQTILVGNFGDGKINVFDTQGNYKGQLQNNGKTIAIDGLWALDFLENNVPGGTANDQLFFTAGPNEEAHGLFGYLKKQ